MTSTPSSVDLPSAWDAVAHSLPAARGTKRDLLVMSRRLEREALADGARTVLVTFQERRHLTAASRASYGRLARTGATVVAFARGLVSDYRPDSAGLVHVALLPRDPVVHEWDVVVLGPRPVAFVARDLAPASDLPDLDRPFSWARTTDPALVDAAASALLARVPVPLQR